MNVLHKISSKLQQWLDGDDPDRWISDGPTANELTKNLNNYSLSSKLPYVSFDQTTNLYHNAGTMGFVLECAPLVGCDLLIQQTLVEIFTNAMPEGAIVQILLYGSPKIGTTLEEYCVARSGSSDLHKITARNLALYLNQGALNVLFPRKRFLIKDFKVYISVIVDNDCLKTATSKLEQTKMYMLSSLNNANISCLEVRPLELIRLVRELTSSSEQSTLPEEVDYDPNQPLAKQMVSPFNHLLVKSTGIQLGQKTIVKVLSAENFPKIATQEQMVNTIGNVFGRSGQISCPFLFACNLYFPDQVKQHTQALVQAFRWERLATSVLGKWVGVAKDAHADWQHAINRVDQHGDKWVKCQFLIALYTDPEHALEEVVKVQNNFNNLGWKKLSLADPLSFPLWLNCLPMNHHPLMMLDAEKFNLTKLMLGSNGASIAPLQGEWKGTPKTPILLFVGRNGQLMPWNPFANERDGGNFNISVTGKPGSGKSFLMQMIEHSVHSLGGQVWAIDEGCSHQKTCELLGGQIIDFKQRDLCFNPFTNIKVLTDSHTQLLVPMITNMALHQRAATELEQSFIEEAVTISWGKYGADNSITRIAEILLANKEQIARDLGQMLFPYTKNGRFGKYVEGRSNIDFTNPYTVLELGELKQHPSLQTVIMLMFINQVTLALNGDRSIPKLLSIDEGWRHLFTPHTAQFLDEASRTVRKHGGAVMTGTQSLKDYYTHPTGVAILNNSDWLLVFNQSGAAEALEQRISMDRHKQQMLESVTTSYGEYSEVFIHGSFGYTVGRFIVDPFTRILYSSKPEEYTAVDQLRKKGYSLIDAVGMVAGVSL